MIYTSKFKNTEGVLFTKIVLKLILNCLTKKSKCYENHSTVFDTHFTRFLEP